MSPVVVGGAVCSSSDSEGRIPGHHSGAVEGPALPADYQLLRQGQGRNTHLLAQLQTSHMADTRKSLDIFVALLARY